MIRPAAPSARLAGGGILPSRSPNPTIVASINPHLRTPLGLFHQPVHAHVRVGKHSAESGRKVYYGTLPDLIDSLEEAQAARRLTQPLTHPPLPVVDELGYLLVTRSGAIFFFQLINRRYERASTVLTSNKGFEEWGRILGDEVMAAPRSSTGCSTVATSSTDSENPENPEVDPGPPA